MRANNPAKVDLTLVRGNAIAYQFDWFPGGTGVDLSDYQGRLDVKRSPFNDDRILEVSGSTIDSEGNIINALAAYMTNGNGFTLRSDATFGNGFLALNFGFSGSGFTTTNGSILFQIDSEIASNIPEGNHHYELEVRGSDTNAATKLARGSFFVAPGGEAAAFGITRANINVLPAGSTVNDDDGDDGSGFGFGFATAAAQVGKKSTSVPTVQLGADIIGVSGATTPYRGNLGYRRWADGDIYGYVVLTDDDETTRDDFRVNPRSTQFGLQEPTGIVDNGDFVDDRGNSRLSNLIGSEGFAGMLIGGGAAGRKPASGEPQVPVDWDHPADAIDHQRLPTPEDFDAGFISRKVKRPTLTKFTYWGGREIKDIRHMTFAQGFLNASYIDQEGKLKGNISLGYGDKIPGRVSALDDAFSFESIYEDEYTLAGGYNSPIDQRLGELFFNSTHPNHNPNIRLVHVARAADSCIVTLDDTGAIRVIATTDPSPGSAGSFGRYSTICYWDKDDVAAGFFTDENGAPVVNSNNDYAYVEVTGSGAGGQGVVVWAIDNKGNLYGAEVHAQMENKVTQAEVNLGQQQKIRPVTPVLGGTANNDWMTFRSRLGLSAGIVGQLNVPSNLYEATLPKATSILRPDEVMYPAFDAETGSSVTRGVTNGVALSIAQTIRRIPVPAGATARMRVVNVKPGYANGGIATCVDESTTPQPTLPTGVTQEVNRPLYKAELVTLGIFGAALGGDDGHTGTHSPISGPGAIQKIIDREVRRHTSTRPLDQSNTGGWTYGTNADYDKDLEKFLFVDEDDSGNTFFCPPVVVSHSRAHTCIMTGHGAGKKNMQAIISSMSSENSDGNKYHFMGSTLASSGTSFGNATYEGPPFTSMHDGTATRQWAWNSGSPLAAYFDVSESEEGNGTPDTIVGSVGYLNSVAGNVYAYGVSLDEEGQAFISGDTFDALCNMGLGNPPGGFSGSIFGSGRGSYFRFAAGNTFDADANRYVYNWFSHYDPDYEYNFWDHTHCLYNNMYTLADGVSAPGSNGYVYGNAYAQVFDWNKTGFSGGSTANPVFSRFPGSTNAFVDPVLWWEAAGDSLILMLQSGRIIPASYRTSDFDALAYEPFSAPVTPKAYFNSRSTPNWDNFRDGPEVVLYPGIGGANASGDINRFVENSAATSEGGHAATGSTIKSVGDILGSIESTLTKNSGFGLTL